MPTATFRISASDLAFPVARRPAAARQWPGTRISILERLMMLDKGLATAPTIRPRLVVDTDDSGELLNYLKGIRVPVRDLRVTGAARKFRHRRTFYQLGRCRFIRTNTSAYEARTDEGGQIFAFGSIRGSRSIESASTRVTSHIGRPAIIVPYQEARFETPGHAGFMAILPIQEVANEIGLAPLGGQWAQRSALASELSKPSAVKFLHCFEFVWP